MEQKNKGNTKLQIISVGTKMFLENGYSGSSTTALANELGISKGNLTFHFPTKEHLLYELVKMLTDFQWNIITKMEQNNMSNLERYCSEVSIQIAICDESDTARDFYQAAYNSPMTLEHIKEWTYRKNFRIFHEYLPEWTMRDFKDVENIASSVEGGIIRVPSNERFTLEKKITVTLDSLLKIYEIEPDERRRVIETILKNDYREEGRRVLDEFMAYVKRNNEDAIGDV